MSDPVDTSETPEPEHFARAVTELGDRRTVVSSEEIFNAQGVKILDKGVVVDTRLFERLTQHQLKHPLSQSVEAESPVTAQVVHDAAQALLESEPVYGAMFKDDRLRDMLLVELKLVPLPAPIAFQLTLARDTQPELWMHSLRSAVTAAWLISRLDGARHDMRMLAAAGLLHDLGMLHVNPVLLQPAVQLDRASRRQLYTHPVVSRMLLERHHEYAPQMLAAVLEHHERLDGSGYPRRLSGDEQSLWGRVLALTELVTAMVTAATPTPSRRLSIVLRMNRHRYDPALVKEVNALLAGIDDAEAAPNADNAVPDLVEIDKLLSAWKAPEGIEALDEARKSSVTQVQEQCAQLTRMLAAAGSAPAQLEVLGDPGDDAALAGELALIRREAAWQLRVVSRQARRLWSLDKDEDYPGWLADWLSSTDSLCARCLGTVEAPAAQAAPDPASEAGAASA